MMTMFLAPNMASAETAEISKFGLSTGTALYWMAYVGTKFVTFGASLVNWTINLNGQVLDNPAVKIGWPVSRDVANLGFVFAIIVIAFSTILQYESYHMQKTLFRLIWVALLINFSLVIAAVFIDFSSVLTHFFINKTSNPNELALVLANSLQVQKLILNNPPPDKLDLLAGIITGNFGGILDFTANLFFVLFFTVIAAISMFGLAFMMFARYVWLVILLTIAPIAWLAHTWPDLDKLWSQWWNKFFQYIWFAPAMSFFLYLAISIVKRGSIGESIGEVLGAQTFSFEGAGASLAQMITVLGILYGGMYTANAAGIYGAGATVKAFDTFKGWVKAPGTWAKSGLYSGAGWVGSRAIKGALSSGVDSDGQNFGQRLGSTLMRVPLMKGVGLTLRESATAAARGGTSEDVSAYRKRIENAGYDSYKTAKDAMAAATTDAEKAAWAQHAMDKGWDKNIEEDEHKADKPRMQEYMRAAEKIGGKEYKEIMASRPDLSGYHLSDSKEASAKIEGATKKVSDPTKLNPIAFENASVAMNIKIDRVLSKGSTKQLESLIKGLHKAIEELEEMERANPDSAESKKWRSSLSRQMSYAAQNTAFTDALQESSDPVIKNPVFQNKIYSSIQDQLQQVAREEDEEREEKKRSNPKRFTVPGFQPNKDKKI